ncbi:MAG: type II toxin-antitoxin system VapC family toxin [Proteobacteria bacterium]|nr:type II toxin-antitoxin system VapC family toxin [Pseudomonadota bacterium]
MYLVDTNVISVGAPSRARAAIDLVAWMDEHSAELYLSTVTVAEIEDGIAKARREKATRKAADLTAWLETLLHLYSDRILAFDVAAARIAGALSDVARSSGRTAGFADIAIAATAKAHGLVILTRNARHFVPLGVPTLNPTAAATLRAAAGFRSAI